MSQTHGFPLATFVSSADYSAKPYAAVILHTVRNQIVLSGNLGKVIGFLQDTPNIGEDTSVKVAGFTLAWIGEASLSTGDFLTAIDTGKLEQVDANDEFCCGILVDDSGTVADGDYREIFITKFTASAGDA